ncbi:glycoside hydrolase family 43 protein [Hymenobacter cellulosivorans]|uniref:Glycoside hydrolase family 43 protein n=1 Tax=Hymenobacter cellulosivorans TaxID=2932249 RepID=A0ABY4F5L6_9BACT|nr:glycoside hydrolase family 43 protein [Hymenobacter cellulosivorans]UOQ51209.1 glycoside hydrolase family 43 protein [Hymenobacter cellulosivorans]
MPLPLKTLVVTAVLAVTCLLTAPTAHTQQVPQGQALVFAYFKGNSKDGLHLAYSRDGYHWKALKNDSSFLKPAVAHDRLMRDPCILRGPDGRFHMVWTVSWNDKGIGYASSPDLVHWSEQQFVPVMQPEAGARNCWAPEINYDPQTRQYVIYWASTITGRFPETQAQGESSYNHRIYYTTTQDFKTYAPARLLYEPGFNVIDASIQPYKKGYVMFLKDETVEPKPQKNLRLAYAKLLTGPYEQLSAPITGDYWAEGPTAVRLGQDWLVYFDKYRLHRYGAVRSRDLKTWTDVSDQIQLPAGLRHGTILPISEKELQVLLKVN